MEWVGKIEWDGMGQDWFGWLRIRIECEVTILDGIEGDWIV